MARVFVAGCGFVGLALCRVLHTRGWTVTGATHSSESAAALAGEPFRVTAADLTNPAALENLGEFEAVVHCASSGRGGADAYRAVYLGGARHLAAAFPKAFLLFTSSTSVYAQIDGGWVTEESPAEPDRETGRILRETEDLVLAHGGNVARLAGLYGPRRSVLLRKFLSGEAVIEGDGLRWINQVHRDDVATALAALLERRAAGIFNVCDDQPLPQREVYEWLAAHFQKPLPPSGPIDPNRKRGWTNKRVSNARLHELGWSAAFPSFFDAVTQEGARLAAE